MYIYIYIHTKSILPYIRELVDSFQEKFTCFSRSKKISRKIFTWAFNCSETFGHFHHFSFSKHDGNNLVKFLVNIVDGVEKDQPKSIISICRIPCLTYDLHCYLIRRNLHLWKYVPFLVKVLLLTTNLSTYFQISFW